MNPVLPESFAQLLQYYRKAAGLTQEALAEHANLSARAISDLERGVKRRPRRETLQLLITALTLTPADAARLAAAARAVAAPAAPEHPAPLPQNLPRPSDPLDERPNNLPILLTTLIGREAECRHARTLLGQPEVRLLTITGPPGVGKTRLALQLAADLLADFSEGAWFIELVALEDAELLAATLAGALGIRQEPGQPLLAQLRDQLRHQQLLLILDNFEQVAEGATLVADLLGIAPNLKVLVTSRVRLQVRGEKELPLAPLALPAGMAPAPMDTLARSPAVALFLERARDVQPDFQLTPENAGAVAAICRRLDGLPLAIELAAVRSKILAPAALLTRLESRLPLLTRGGSDLPAHQQTLRDTITWSYNLLNPGEQQMFQQVAVFAGGFTLAAAEVVCGAAAPEDGADAAGPPGPASVLDGITALVDQSLLQTDPGAVPRFQMLETIREYAAERLVASGAAPALRQRHAAYYQALAEAAAAGGQGAQAAAWAQRLEVEHDNLRAALAWAQETAQPEMGARLAAALARFWATHGYLSEGRRWLEGALAAGQRLPAPLRARVLDGAGEIAYWQAEYAAARAWAEEALALQRTLADPARTAEALTSLGRILWRQGDPAGAQALLTESLALRRASGAAPGGANTQRQTQLGG
jgi:predicted ATPase/transcriptional regulator with XRE-family HTH domain